MEYVHGKTINNSDEQAQSDFSINNCGYYRQQEHDMNIVRDAARKDYQIIFVKHGKVLLEFGGKKFQLTDNEIVCISKNTPHKYTYKSGEIT